VWHSHGNLVLLDGLQSDGSLVAHLLSGLDPASQQLPALSSRHPVGDQRDSCVLRYQLAVRRSCQAGLLEDTPPPLRAHALQQPGVDPAALCAVVRAARLHRRARPASRAPCTRRVCNRICVCVQVLSVMTLRRRLEHSYKTWRQTTGMLQL
jgi:hypothetical protein